MTLPIIAPERLEAQRRNADALRTGLRARGYDTGNSASAIVEMLVGEEIVAWRLARRLFDEALDAFDRAGRPADPR